MKGALAGFLVGLVLAVAAAWMWRTTRREVAPATPDSAVAQVPAVAGDPAPGPDGEGEAARRAAELTAANEKLLAELMQARSNLAAQARSAGAVTSGPPATPEAGTERRLPMRGLMQAALRQQVDSRIERMKERLDLTPEQESAIRDLLEKQLAFGVAQAERMFDQDKGKGPAADSPANPGDVESAIRGLLTAEQLEEYDGLKSEEQVANARLVANSEMLQMQQTLGLSLEQQDRVYAVLYEETQALLASAGAGGAGTQALTPRGLIERKLTSLERSGALTPSQLARYRELQETQLRLIESMLPKGGNGDVIQPQVQVLAPSP